MAFEKDLIERLRNLNFRESERDEFYAGSYSLFLEFFRDRIAVDPLIESDAKVGVFLTYSWMGRGKVKTSQLKNFGAAAAALKKARSGKVNVVELKSIMNFVGGSLVATSKYLHFLNPKCFAIWDSRVAWAGYRRKSTASPKKYLQYLEDLAGLRLPKELSDKISEKMPEATEMRVKEYALFQLGIQEDVKKSSK